MKIEANNSLARLEAVDAATTGASPFLNNTWLGTMFHTKFTHLKASEVPSAGAGSIERPSFQ